MKPTERQEKYIAMLIDQLNREGKIVFQDKPIESKKDASKFIDKLKDKLDMVPEAKTLYTGLVNPSYLLLASEIAASFKSRGRSLTKKTIEDLEEETLEVYSMLQRCYGQLCKQNMPLKHKVYGKMLTGTAKRRE